MRLAYLGAAALALVLAGGHGGTANAQDIACDTTYRTQSGDTLSGIAQRAFGRSTAYQRIFDYNPGKMKTPNRVPRGVELYIPCPTGTQDAGELPELPDTRSGDLRILTGKNYQPYVDPGLPNGGFSYELVERAMQYGAWEAEYRIDMIGDWGAHLRILLADGMYDLGFPWFKPDCSEMAKLGENSRWRCANLRWSKPLHEVVVTFYAAANVADSISQPADTEGMKLCRPKGYFTHDLEVRGLVPPRVIRVAGDDPQDCFERLADGEVDLVSVNADTSDNVITELGIRDRVAEVIDLATIQTLHVVGMRTNPETRVHLLRIDKGLRGLRKDGTFRALAAKHLQAN